MKARLFRSFLLLICLMPSLALAQPITDGQLQSSNASGAKRTSEKTIQEFNQAIAKMAPAHTTSQRMAVAAESKSFDPRMPLVLNDRAVVYLAKGNYPAAISDLDWAIALNPSLAQAWHNRALAHYYNGNLTSAYADFSRASELEPRNAYAFFQLGSLKYLTHNLVGAYADLNRALEINTNYAQALFVRGKILRELGQYDLALADFTKCLQIEPRWLAVLNLRGNTWQNKGENNEALEDFNRALALNKKQAEIWCNRGNVRLLQGDLAGALADYNHALALKPLASAYNNRGVLYRSLGRWQEASGDFEQALRLNPSYDIGLLNRSLLSQQRATSAAVPPATSSPNTSDPVASEVVGVVFTFDLAGELLSGTENPGRTSVTSEKTKVKLRTP